MRKIGCLFLVLALASALLFAGILWTATRTFGPSSAKLSWLQRVQYAGRVLLQQQALLQPANPQGKPQSFSISLGESVPDVALRLEAGGLIPSARAFRDYLVYRGLDATLQAGDFELSPAMTPLDIAAALQNPVPRQTTLVILPGWRLEEVAAALPHAGFGVSPDEFLLAASLPPSGYDFLAGAQTIEGFIFPDAYTLPRDLDAMTLAETFLQRFGVMLTPDLREGFARQGVTVYQAVTLASIVQRESVHVDEMPLIASVFYNRLRAGMKLESDPTVQYAIGYDANRGGWWPVPLTYADLEVDSPYNTYRYAGLPPSPIASPSLAALQAVAFPAETPYFYFRAACDGSGRHNFARTYEEHIRNGCE